MVTGGILGPSNHLLDSPSLTPGEYGDSPVPTPRSSSAASMAEEDVSAVTTAAAQFTKLRRGMDEKEFTVQIKDVSSAFRHWKVGKEAPVLLSNAFHQQDTKLIWLANFENERGKKIRAHKDPFRRNHCSKGRDLDLCLPRTS